MHDKNKINEPNESESTAFPGKAISGDVNIAYFAASFKDTPQIFRRRTIRQIIDFKRNHAVYTWRWPPVTHLRQFGNFFFENWWNFTNILRIR